MTTYLLAGGGTAGHVNPLLAVADRLRDTDPAATILVLGTREGLEARLVPARGYELLTIPKLPFPRRPGAAMLRFPGALRRTVGRVRRMIDDRAVDVVVGFGGYASAPAYLAARAERTPFVVHEANAKPGFANRLGARFTRFYFNNVLGNPLDTTVALHYLIFDGVLERYPALKILAVHGGGFLPAYSGRIDHAWGARSDSRGSLPQPPTHYLRKVWFDTIVFSPHQLEYLVKVYGVEKIMMGTDFPFDMADSDPIGHICSVESFDDATRAALAGGSAKALLGL